MQENSIVGELDLAIVNALQINPRADWSRLGPVLGVSATTAARRWRELTQRGLAWVTPAPGPHYLGAGWSAFVHISSRPADQSELVERLCAEPGFGTVSAVSGPYDLFVDCFATSGDELMELVAGAFARLPGVVRREVVFVTKLYRQAHQWRGGALERAQARRLVDPVRAVAGGFVPDGVDVGLVRQLGRDGRAGWAELGQACSISPQTARRRIERLIGAGYLVMRCDAAAAIRQGQREVSLILNVPATRLDVVAGYFAGLPGCRVAAQVLGVQNLVVTLWVRDFLEIQVHERKLAELAAGAAVISRQAVVRAYKRMGHLLDAAGRSVGMVPVPLWR